MGPTQELLLAQFLFFGDFPASTRDLARTVRNSLEVAQGRIHCQVHLEEESDGILRLTDKAIQILNENEHATEAFTFLFTSQSSEIQEIDQLHKSVSDLAERSTTYCLHWGSQPWWDVPGNSLSDVEEARLVDIDDRSKLKSKIEEYERIINDRLNRAEEPTEITLKPVVKAVRPQISLGVMPKQTIARAIEPELRSPISLRVEEELANSTQGSEPSYETSKPDASSSQDHPQDNSGFLRRFKSSKLVSIPAKNEVERNDEIRSEEVRSQNGYLTIGEGSRINTQPWQESGWSSLADKFGQARDFECEYGVASNLLVVGGSVRGAKHRLYGAENQDAFALKECEEIFAFAVCDGVSSAKYAAYASRFISQSFVRHLSLNCDKESSNPEIAPKLIADAVASAVKDVGNWSTSDPSCPDVEPTSFQPEEIIRYLATTLCCGFIQKEAIDGQFRFWVLSIGDSPAYVLQGKQWKLVSGDTKEGDVLSHGTDALPKIDMDLSLLVESVSSHFLEEDEFLVVVTDGISTSLGDGNTDVGTWFAEKIPSIQNSGVERNLIDLLTFDRKGEDDDRTAVIVRPKSMSGNER